MSLNLRRVFKATLLWNSPGRSGTGGGESPNGMETHAPSLLGFISLHVAWRSVSRRADDITSCAPEASPTAPDPRVDRSCVQSWKAPFLFQSAHSEITKSYQVVFFQGCAVAGRGTGCEPALGLVDSSLGPRQRRASALTWKWKWFHQGSSRATV